jgi:pyruvate dehydrogenase E2 component (dihydrolipoamide acetyltransferase)
MQHVILLPDLGQTTSEARVLKWWKQPGERVLRGEPLLAVETDKVDMDVESFVDGFLRQVLVESGAVATALKPIAIVTDSLEETYDVLDATPAIPAASPSASPSAAAVIPQRIWAAPAAKALAGKLGIELGVLTGTGPNGLIVQKDVRRYAERCQVTDVRALSAMASMVAVSKRDIPHFYATLDADTALAETWRANWNSSRPGLRASINDIFVRCAARALVDTPRLNIRLRDGRYEQSGAPRLLLVVARESGLALVEAPDPLGAWDQFLDSTRMAIQKGPRTSTAASEQAPPPVLAVSNLGMHGVKEFMAIIPPGCTAALAIGAVRDAPVVRSGRLEVGRICTLTLSADHRVVDGVTAARFLQRMQHHLNSL